MHASRDGLCQSCIKTGEISNFGFLQFFFFFSFSLIWDHMGEKTLNGISSESAQQFPTRDGLYQSCIKNCEISNFGFLTFFFCSW